MAADESVHPLREAREGRELRQADVASEAGVSIAFVSMLESGYRPKREDKLDRVAQVFSASVGSFW